ncbi:MAG TPA: restriction endonuclease [Longimicrobiaceae bacterium]
MHLSKFAGSIDRPVELDLLFRAVVEQGHRVVGVFGPPGVGKTLLTRVFGEQNRRAFPGGLQAVEANTLHWYTDDRSGHFDDLFPRLTFGPGRSLLIVDDVDRIGRSQLDKDVRHVLSKFNTTSILLTSRAPIRSKLIQGAIELGTFSPERMTQFIQQQLDISGDLLRVLLSKVGGNPLTATIAADAVNSGAFTLPQLLHAFKDVHVDGILDAHGQPLGLASPAGRQIITDITEISEELLFALRGDPGLLYRLPPRKFEELVAELLTRQGYEISLTPISRDGGKDVYAATKTDLGSFLYLVECKRFAPDHPVSVGVVRSLYGVVEAERATAGIVATTSYFTSGAAEFQQSVSYRLSLQDYLGIKKWLDIATRHK